MPTEPSAAACRDCLAHRFYERLGLAFAQQALAREGFGPVYLLADAMLQRTVAQLLTAPNDPLRTVPEDEWRPCRVAAYLFACEPGWPLARPPLAQSAAQTADIEMHQRLFCVCGDCVTWGQHEPSLIPIVKLCQSQGV
jgi:hypothetical protein